MWILINILMYEVHLTFNTCYNPRSTNNLIYKKILLKRNCCWLKYFTINLPICIICKKSILPMLVPRSQYKEAQIHISQQWVKIFSVESSLLIFMHKGFVRNIWMFSGGGARMDDIISHASRKAMPWFIRWKIIKIRMLLHK